MRRLPAPSLFLLLALPLLAAGLQAPAAHSAEQAAITVSTFQDELNNDGDCSLREAIQAANSDSPVDVCPAGNGADVILLPSGLYTLSLVGDDDFNQVGDLDIRGDLLLQGAAAAESVLDAGGVDRALHLPVAAAVTVRMMTIRNGNAADASLYGGGAILNERGDLTVKESVLLANQTSKVGGALDNASTALIVDSTIQENNASAGGGIFNEGSLQLRNSLLLGNFADHTGGALDNTGDATLSNVTISGNSVSDDPGAAGGGVFSDGVLTLLNVTINANSTGIENKYQARVKSTIIANSTAGDNCTGQTNLTSEGNNLDSGNSCSFDSAGDLADTPPLLGALSENGGLTLTYPLMDGSPAIDGGDDLDCPEIDQRGAFRPADGDNDGVETCDIGAYEHLGAFPQYVYLPLVSRRP
jgi:CSLREA domain-containing protein